VRTRDFVSSAHESEGDTPQPEVSAV
jgi:hypothetical protein